MCQGNSKAILKVVGFIISCGAKFVTGSVFVFFLYQDDIKNVFLYTQSEAELLASMINIGLGLGFLPGIFFDHFGPTRTSLAGLLLASGSYFLVWSTTFDVPFFQRHVWLMAIYFLLAGFGPGFTLMVCFNTNAINFGNQHTGKVVGILNAFFAGSPSIFATVYYRFFALDSYSHSKRFADFILMIGIMFAVANTLCLIFVRFYREVDEPNEQIFVSANNETTENANRDNSATESTTQPEDDESEITVEIPRTMIEESVPLKTVLLNCDFQTVIWAFSFASAVSVVFGVNITVISKAVAVSGYDRYLTIILPICNAVLSLFIGVFSDYFKVHIPRLLILIFGCICFVVLTSLVVAAAEYIAVLMIAAAFCGIGVAIIYSIGPTIIKEMTSAVNLGRNWGVALFLQSAIGLPSQLIFGAMYDAQVKHSGQSDCVGKNCIAGGMGVFVGMSTVAVILLIILYCRKRCQPYRRHGYEQLEG